MRLFSELLQCPENQFPRRVTMLERLHESWKYDQLVPTTRSSSEADSEDVTFGRDPLRSPSGSSSIIIIAVIFICSNRVTIHRRQYN